MNLHRARTIALIATAGLLATACGGDDDDTATPEGTAAEGTAAPTATEGTAAPTATEAPAPGDSAPSGSEAPVPATDACSEVDLGAPPAEPVEIRLGHGASTEEPVYLQFLDPEVAGAEHSGTWYTIEATEYAPPDRLAAFQAGALDAGTISTPQLFTAVAQDLPLVAVASIATVSEDSEFSFPYLALDDSGIDTIEDLQGKTIGIIAPNTATEYWVKSAAVAAGLDPDRDIQTVAIPPPTAEQALRDGQVDVQFMSNTFLPPVLEAGGVHEVFDALTGPGFDHELLDVFFDEGFIAENPGAFCAWRQDYQASMAAYLADPVAAGQVLVDGGLDPAPDGEAFAARPDTARSEDGAIDMENLQKLIDDMIESQFLPGDLEVSAADVVLDGYSLTK